MSDIRQARTELEARILEGSGTTTRAQRRAAFGNLAGSEPTGRLIEKVAWQAHRISDADIAETLALGFSEDQVFEIVVCAALGQASRQLDTALAALDTATQGGEHASRNPR